MPTISKNIKIFFFYTDRYDTNRKHQQSFPDNIHYKKHQTTTQTTNNPITLQSKSFHHSFKKIKKNTSNPIHKKASRLTFIHPNPVQTYMWTNMNTHTSSTTVIRHVGRPHPPPPPASGPVWFVDGHQGTSLPRYVPRYEGRDVIATTSTLDEYFSRQYPCLDGRRDPLCTDNFPKRDPVSGQRCDIVYLLCEAPMCVFRKNADVLVW